MMLTKIYVDTHHIEREGGIFKDGVLEGILVEEANVDLLGRIAFTIDMEEWDIVQFARGQAGYFKHLVQLRRKNSTVPQTPHARNISLHL